MALCIRVNLKEGISMEVVSIDGLLEMNIKVILYRIIFRVMELISGRMGLFMLETG